MTRRNGQSRHLILALVLMVFPGWYAACGGTEMSNEQSTSILSADFAVAEQALSEGVKNGDVDLVGLALGNPHLEIKLQATEALGHMGDKKSIPQLWEALEENQVYYTGGSEIKILQVELNKALVNALQKLTGVDYGIVDPASAADIQRVLQTAHDNE
jgi:hypothetical protein